MPPSPKIIAAISSRPNPSTNWSCAWTHPASAPCTTSPTCSFARVSAAKPNAFYAKRSRRTLGRPRRTTHWDLSCTPPLAFARRSLCYQKAISLKADYAHAHNNLGASLHELKRPEEAIPHYQKALAIDQNYADAWRNLGFAWQATGRIEEARAAFKTAIAIAPSIPSLYHGLAPARSFLPATLILAAMKRSFRRQKLFRFQNASCCILRWQKHWMM